MSRYVVFKTNSFPTFSETFIVSNIIEAINAGFEIKIIVDSINEKTNTSQPNLLEQYGLLDKVLKFDQPKGNLNRKVKAIYLLLNPLMLYFFIKYILYKGKKSFDYAFILNFYWKYRKAVAYHVHFATAIHPLFDLKEIGFFKSKIIVTFHGYDEHGLPKGLPLKNIIHNFNKYVSHITTNTLYLKDKLVNKGFPADKIKIIPIGINTGFFQNDADEFMDDEFFKLITVGRFVEIKGQAYGVMAVKLLKDKGYKITYTLVGYGDEYNNLQELVCKLNLKDEVVFCGSKDQNEIKALLKEQHLFLMTSTSDKVNRCETFGVVSLEAQAMGVPVVGFKSGGFPETLIEGKTGITVEDKNINKMVEAIELLINDNKMRNRISIAAKRHIKDNFDSSKVTIKYIELYS